VLTCNTSPTVLQRHPSSRLRTTHIIHLSINLWHEYAFLLTILSSSQEYYFPLPNIEQDEGDHQEDQIQEEIAAEQASIVSPHRSHLLHVNQALEAVSVILGTAGRDLLHVQQALEAVGV
jgi:hypothetical protein